MEWNARLVASSAVILVLASPAWAQTGAQPVQYRSPAGVEYRSLPDTDAVRTARAALEKDPRNIARIVDLGVAQSGARQFREAIATFTRGLEIEPNNALLLRWRGHRYLSVREFDKAIADLKRGASIDSSIYGIWYHLGVLQFLRGEFADAAASFSKALPIAPDSGEQQGSVDWLWMSLSRAGRDAEAKAMLDRRADAKPPDGKPVVNAYTRRLQLYRGEIGPGAVMTAADTDEVQVATLAYGLGNWYLVRGDKANARKWFERSVESGGWPGFGFIVSEQELKRIDTANAQEHHAPHWTYAGKEGPAHWAELDQSFAACQAGHKQSPIDIRNAKPAALPAIQFDYQAAPLHIINNGHTIQVNYAPGSWITVGGQRYELQQFHFHHPSEEHINGRGFQMVAHLVHRAADGRLAVVAVLLDPGAEDAATASIWTHLPAHEGPEQMLDNVTIDARGLLPKERGYYTFSGSLTTPPCTEDVAWFVLKTPKRIARSQADQFGKLYPNDARPMQPLYGREVLVSK